MWGGGVGIMVGKVYLCYSLSHPGHNTLIEMQNGGSGTRVMLLVKYAWTFKAVWRTWGPWGSFALRTFQYIFDLYPFEKLFLQPYLTKPMRKKKNERKYSDSNTRCSLQVLTDFVISLNKECFHSKANRSVSQEESCILNDSDYFNFITIFTNIYFLSYIESGHFQQLNGAEFAFCLWSSCKQ